MKKHRVCLAPSYHTTTSPPLRPLPPLSPVHYQCSEIEFVLASPAGRRFTFSTFFFTFFTPAPHAFFNVPSPGSGLIYGPHEVKNVDLFNGLF